jgi:hypothetical protein
MFVITIKRKIFFYLKHNVDALRVGDFRQLLCNKSVRTSSVRELTAFTHKIYSIEWSINLYRSCMFGHRFEMSR